MTRDLAVHAEGLVRTFGDVRALDGIDLTVERGQVVGLLGPNGAGKTTTVRILSTLLAPTEGRATVAGFDVVKQADEVRRSIGLTGQYAAIDEYLTGRENLRMFGGLYHLSPKYVKERSDELLDWFDLSDAADRPAKTYSGGMRRRLDLAASLVAQPSILFLDEPTTGLHFNDIKQLLGVLNILVEKGNTVVVIEHNMDVIKVADWVVDIGPEGGSGGGQVLTVGTPEQVANVEVSHTGRFLKLEL